MKKISNLAQVKVDAERITLKRIREQLEEEADKAAQAGTELEPEKKAMLAKANALLNGKFTVQEIEQVEDAPVETKKGK